MPFAAENTVGSLTAHSITTMIRSSGKFPDATVEDVTASPIGTGQMAASYRLELRYATAVPNAPACVVAKVASTDAASRQMAATTGAYRREVQFYQKLAGQVRTRTPECFYADIAEDGVSFVALLEDLGPAKMVEQIGGCTADQAALALGQAAALHGSSWQQDYLREPWLPADSVWNMLGSAIPAVAAPWLDRFGQYLNPEHVAAVNRLADEVGSWLATLRNHRTLWHGDFRLDNLLFDAQGGAVPVAVVDWQSVAAAPGVIDVSYFLGTSMTEAEREKHERDLVTEYHEQLSSYGVTNYPLEVCLQEYRAHALFALVLTIPVSMGVQATERGDAMFAAMARRAADQIIANDSFEALRSL
ncbi:phosphotransferase [Mycolicibacterium helvum]|uniref:Aminoglycoside phosphotransferase n=1 Tax=Mycolicibacterium helvum TaxID=1534349 RepID=A0A7I7TCQ1_9MYCO|nr:phosphotransferase [Mycolicibacterium helvum]BBY67022.1 aminoglycoside phosphotransferase [Mycolicibacterium helvum]